MTARSRSLWKTQSEETAIIIGVLVNILSDWSSGFVYRG